MTEHMQGSAPANDGGVHSHSEYKIVLLGESGVGKTTYVTRMLTGDFERKHEPTVGADVHTVKSTHSDNYFTFWDTAGKGPKQGLSDGYYIAADAALLFYDPTNTESVEHLEEYYKDFCRVCKDTPVILVGTKTDVMFWPRAPGGKACTQVQRRLLRNYKKAKAFAWDHNLFHVRIATKTCYNWEKPTHFLEQALQTNDNAVAVFGE